jgi:hypothetical protein
VGIFAYNGSLGPADSPFTFKVSRGEGSYVGTLVMSWEVPKNVLELGRPVIVRRHGRLHCSTFFSCNVFAPNGGVVKAPYADVAVFDEGPGFLMGLKVEYPNLPDIAITGGLMH